LNIRFKNCLFYKNYICAFLPNILSIVLVSYYTSNHTYTRYNFFILFIIFSHIFLVIILEFYSSNLDELYGTNESYYDDITINFSNHVIVSH
jgi:hypothetical protein